LPGEERLVVDSRSASSFLAHTRRISERCSQGKTSKFLFLPYLTLAFRGLHALAVVYLSAGLVNLVGATLLGAAKVDGALAGTLVGYLSAKAEQVLAYYFGSTAGSARKTELLAQSAPIGNG